MDGESLIYFDNAATTWPKPKEMIEAMVAFNDSIGANPGRSGHRLSIEAARVIYSTRELICELINAPDPLSIILTKNATEGINCCLMGLLKQGDHVITSSMEHNSVMRPLRFLETKGVTVSTVLCSPSGEIDLDDIRGAINKHTKMIAITHASNVTGTVMPIEEIARVAKEHGIFFFVDAAQTIGNREIDVIKVGIDILCFSGHKSLYGPQGTGGFYLRKGLEEFLSPLMMGGTGSASEFERQPDFLPDKYESGTPNGIGFAGLAASVRFVLGQGVDRIRAREKTLTKIFLDGLKGIEGVMLYGVDDPSRRTGTVSFNIRGVSPSDISSELDEKYRIMVRPGLHCAPSAHRTIGTFPQGTVRFSFGFFNTEEEILYGIKAIEEIAKTYYNRER
ncbi:MAG: aminotransferase class V-fold PLP-dependent enzyme [Syntrophorhabdaceae bacterium]|nr:aminotransferase class V-fold PLP-dependent enzyme [Syntrophorhabdaceae bacterium]